MLFPLSNSFTPLSIIQLSHRHILHPQACNPSMDLVVLLQPLSGPGPSKPSFPAFASGVKGKAKDVGQRTNVELWRTGGSRVWQVELGGRVGGLAWSRDGLHLSVLLVQFEDVTLEHLSVHTGKVVQSLPLDMPFPFPDGHGQQWVHMEWQDSGLKWEKPRNGSALMIIDSLPRVTPVEPPKPANVLPFMRPAAAATEKAGPHSWLQTFPSILPANPPISPDILHITSRALLAGTFPLPPLSRRRPKLDPAVLTLARISDSMAGFFNVVLRGLENTEAAFRDGEKQTMICREDLETCAQQHDMSLPDVHADLFRFLMTGRSGVAVSEWLGSRLTSRTLAKWDSAMDTSFRTIQKVISESITPSLERITLLLEELRGWSKAVQYTAHLQLPEEQVSRAIDIVLGFATLVERMRQRAQHEMLAAAEFMKWLKYEIVRAASHDRSAEELPLAVHDLKLTWSFLQNGFHHSIFHRHFPYLLVRPPTDLLPPDLITHPRPTARSFDQVLQETTSSLFSPRKSRFPDQDGPGHPTPSQRTDDSFTSNSMSLEMSISDADEDREHTPTKAVAPEEDMSAFDHDLSMESRASSPDTVEKRDAVDADDEVKRELEEEPWVWARTLVQTCEELVRGAVAGKSGTSKTERGDLHLESWDGPSDSRRVEQDQWSAFISTAPGGQQLWLLCQTLGRSSEDSVSVSAMTFSLSDQESSATCPALQFFDDEELVILLQSGDGGGERYLATIRYTDLTDGMIPIDQSQALLSFEEIVRKTQDISEVNPLPISRCRPLSSHMQVDDDGRVGGEKEKEKEKEKAEQGWRWSGKVSLALNGRAGRRLGCVMMERGREVEVLDLEADEDDEEEEEEEEGMEEE